MQFHPAADSTPQRASMSLSLGQTWVRKVIGPRRAREDALRLIEQAAAEKADATLIVGPGLSSNSKCYLARWDGWELAVLELGRVQQEDWNVDPHGLYQELHPAEMPLQEPVAEPLVSLAEARIGAPTYDGWTPLSGTCRFAMDQSQLSGIRSGAVRVQYFRPDLPRPVTAMWYADTILVAPGGELRFRFPPLFSDKNPHHLRGALVVFLQLFTAENWATKSGCRKISNVTFTLVTLQ
jgi:hypothetical protein